MEDMIECLLCENVVEARKLARRYAIDSIRAYCIEVYGWSDRRSSYAALYLKKGVKYWQQFCDAK